MSASWIRSRLVPLVTALLLAMAIAPAAGASVYWTNVSTIGRAGGDGSGVNHAFIGGASAPCGVAADAAHVYWTNSDLGTIGRANLDGTGVDQDFITGANAPCGVAVDRAHVYWTDVQEIGGGIIGGGIGRANLDGTGVDQNFIGGLDTPLSVAVDGAHVYWTALHQFAGGIGRANLDGTGVDQNFIGGNGMMDGVAVDGAHIYWTSFGSGAVGRANLDGTGVDQFFIAVDNGLPSGVAVDSAHIYWTSENTDADDPAGSAIGRANLDGTGVNPALVTGASFPQAVAVDVEQPARISVDDVTMMEGDAGQTAFRFVVSLDKPESAPVTVEFTTSDGTARAPSDYIATTGAVTFAPGETAKQVSVQVNGDTAVEPDETFHLKLTNVTGNATIADTQGVATIVNDDQLTTPPPPTTPPLSQPPIPQPAGTPAGDGTEGHGGRARNPVALKFTLGKVRLNAKTGTARIAVTVPGPGKLAISIGSARAGRVATRSVTAAGTVQLLIRASGMEQRKLARSGRVSVKVRVSYTPIGRRASTRSTNVRLKKR